jgi:diguanylate cyclase (GGDEF)-like protein/PAS domain S-box-containing protein
VPEGVGRAGATDRRRVHAVTGFTPARAGTVLTQHFRGRAVVYSGPMQYATVLLISPSPEDHARFAEVLAAIRGSPFRLEVAGTLAEGLARLKQGRVDAVLLDLELPDSLGLTTFLRVQPKAPQVPIVIVIDATNDDLGREAVSRGALDYLVKDEVSAQILDKVLRYATERTHTLKALKASEQRYRELFQNVTAGVFQTTPDGKFMAANPALVRMLGYDSEDELLGVDVATDVYMDPGHREAWARAMAESGEVRNAELALKRRDGSKIVVLENSRVVRDAEGRALFYEGTLTDITASHEISQQLSYDASHDPLTGLANRREFELRLQHALELTQATGAKHAVCFMDLDRFKVVNDSCGHVAGDELLRQLGQVLEHKVRSADVVARLGGDEFAVLLQNCGPDDAMQVAGNLLKAVDAYQFVWGEKAYTLGVSIGVVLLSSHFRRIAQVMNAADSACYAAKDAGRNRIHVFREDEAVVERHSGEMEWAARAKRALAENRLFLEAQPMIPLAAGSQEMPHYELLVRMRDEKGRTVPPGAFLPAVERYNLAVRYDRWVIDAALDWIRTHPQGLARVSRFFINLSKDSVADPDTAVHVRQAVSSAGVDPRRLGFELSESVAIGNVTRANQLINEFRRLGCATSLDDFGSGVSSFAYLKALAVEYIKIDGMFVGSISQDRVDYAMVRSIKEIGHVMGKKIVAESVETPGVLEKLREIGVDYAQGFEVGLPRPMDEIANVAVADLLAG